jgi:hypothetical protein
MRLNPQKGLQMEMEYGPFGVANLIVDACRGVADAWSAATGSEKLTWILLIAAFPAAAYAVWRLAGRHDRQNYG